MNSDSAQIKRFPHSVGQNWYHVVLVPKYRNPVFRQEHQRKLMLEGIEWFCERHKVDLFAKEVMDDHVHLFLSCPPDYSISKLVAMIKGATSYFIRSRHLPLRRYAAFWSKGAMFRSVGAISAEVVERYIERSNSQMRGQKKLI